MMASVWAVIEQDQKILFVQRSSSTSRPLQWCFPGGGVHKNEATEAACVREVAEEVGLGAIVQSPLLVLPDRCYFHCRVEAGEICLKPNECTAYLWVDPVHLLDIGEIMDLRWVVQVLRLLGFQPEVPPELADLVPPCSSGY
jgi:8-oxo-dGTP pyrophosphatase MutT (NUDIX family)